MNHAEKVLSEQELLASLEEIVPGWSITLRGGHLTFRNPAGGWLRRPAGYIITPPGVAMMEAIQRPASLRLQGAIQVKLTRLEGRQALFGGGYRAELEAPC